MNDSRSVRQLLERALRSGVFPGAVATFARGNNVGCIRTVVVGARSVLQPGAALSEDVWFDVASLTKPLVVGVLSLLAFRRSHGLKLDTRVGEVLSEIPPSSGIGASTVEQLLAHTSGLPAWRPLYAMAEGDPCQVLPTIAGTPLHAPPGARVVYSCLGYILLGLLLERLFGEPLDACFRRLVLEPLGLEHEMGFLPPAGITVAPGAVHPGAEVELVRESGLSPAWIPAQATHLPDDGNARFCGGVAGNAGLFSTAAGVLTLARQYLIRTDDGLLKPDEVCRATRCRTSGLGEHRSLGWQLASTPGCSAGPTLSATAFGHTGFTGTSVWVDREYQIVLVLLTNRHHPAHRATFLHPLRRRFHTLAVYDCESASST